MKKDHTVWSPLTPSYKLPFTRIEIDIKDQINFPYFVPTPYPLPLSLLLPISLFLSLSSLSL